MLYLLKATGGFKYYEVTKEIKQAILREKQIKGWSRKKKEALFREDWDELKLNAAIRKSNK